MGIGKTLEDIQIQCNFMVRLLHPGTRKEVRGSRREAHNVFTTIGRDWLAHLVVWDTIGSPDIAVTQRRLRWLGVGIGSQLEVESVSTLNTPVPVDDVGNFLAPLQYREFSALKTVRVGR
jgi:hypothetical protein